MATCTQMRVSPNGGRVYNEEELLTGVRKYLLFPAVQPNPLFEVPSEINIRNHLPLALHPDALFLCST